MWESHWGRVKGAGAVVTMLATAAAVRATCAADDRGLPDRRYYVDPVAAPGGNGVSPDSAFRDLQDAIDVINHLSGGNIHVLLAPGTYTPDRGTGDRAKSFHFEPVPLTSGMSVTILGAGAWQGGLPAGVSSFLSADLARDDQPGFVNNDENAFTVIQARFRNKLQSLSLVGIGLVGGKIDYWDNVPAQSASAILAETSFEDSGYSYSGLTLRGVVVSGFDAAQVPLIRSQDVNLHFEDCVVQDNRNPAPLFGTSLIHQESTQRNIYLQLNRTTIRRNVSPYGYLITAFGGGCSASFLNCTLDLEGAGGVFCDWSVYAQFTTIKNARRGNAIESRIGDYRYCRFENIGTTAAPSSAAAPAALRVWDGTLGVFATSFVNTDASLRGTGIDATNSVLSIRRCRFGGLREGGFGGSAAHGPAIQSAGGVLNLNHSVFSGCVAESGGYSTRGGAVVATNAHINNSLFVGNRASGVDAAGGAVSMEIGTVSACTYYANLVQSPDPLKAVGGGIDAGPGVIVSSSILWDNADGLGSGAVSQARQSRTLLSPAMEMCTISGYPTMPDFSGNSGADPMFVDRIGPDGTAGTSDDDLRLIALSPCIDTGTNLYSGFSMYETDVYGQSRFLDDPGSLDRGDGSRLDRGAFEFQGTSPTTCRRDINLDGVVDVVDLTHMLRWFSLPVPPRYGPDFDGDGLVGTADLVQLLADFGCVRG